ncbi:MAG: serine/threonine protein kinase [Oscillospiraceae bacterium]|nr:serine/threonine protein kinase [Oscillospiraceae bacterium]
MENLLKVGSVLKAENREYRIIDIIGRGANTAAYIAECTHDSLTNKCILKQYAPHDTDNYENGKQRFIDAAKQQNKIRQLSALTNQTPPVCHIFEADGTVFSDVAIYNGTTLDKLKELSLQQYVEICLTIAKTAGYYHKSGFLCLDLKPENIFVLQNSPDDTITQLVEFIDFDSVHDTDDNAEQKIYSYTRDWAAPEQTNPYSSSKISIATDIYTIGEIAFFLLFGRHSTDSEHRGFSEYPFDDCKREFRKYVMRLDVRAMFTELFRNTLRSSSANRYGDTEQLTRMLENLIYELSRKDYIIPRLPAVSPIFVGRDDEMKRISESLADNRVLFITGIGGIGKSTLVRNFINRQKPNYDVIAYLEYAGDIKSAFTDDMQLQISTVRRQDGESVDEYFTRKLSCFKTVCENKKVLFIIDNYDDMLNKDVQKIIDCGYDTIIVTRRQLPKNSFAVMIIDAIADNAELHKLIELNLERAMSKDERKCFDEIIGLVQGHTLVLELVARQIAAGKLNIGTALELIKENGFSNFSENKIGNYKDGDEVYDTLSAIIISLFDASRLTEKQMTALKTMSLFDVRGFDTDTITRIIKPVDIETLRELHREGWLYENDRVRVHSVIAETMRNLQWADTISDKEVMALHENVIALYNGTANALQINEVIKQAEKYAELHARHFIKGMYFDMVGSYYDTLLSGAYVPYNEEEVEPLEKLIGALDDAIGEMQESDDPDAGKYLAGYYLSLANIFIRLDPEYHEDAAELINLAAQLIDNEPEYTENRCYLCMTVAWYYTQVSPDPKRTKDLTEKAEEIATNVFQTDLEIIDIIYISTANCWFYHNDLESAVAKLNEAIEICEKYPDKLPYIDKKCELLRCLLDVFYEIQDMKKCRELIAEIDMINNKYQDQGVSRMISDDIRNSVE